MSRDLSPFFPEKFRVVFPARRCTANVPEGGYPASYSKTVNLSSITLSDSSVSPRPKGVEQTVWTVRDTAVALYSTAAGPATNQAALDDLAKRAAQDFFDSRSVRFDKVYSGINSIPPNALIDLIEFAYTSTSQTTRIQSQPYGGEPREFQRNDPSIASCHADDRTPGVLLDIPGASVNNSMTGVVTLEDGRLVLTYDATTSVPCGCSPPTCATLCVSVVGCNSAILPGATVSLIQGGSTVATGTTVGQVTSIGVNVAGSGYTPGTTPAVTISGGGGSGAAAVAVMTSAGTSVSAVFITNYGSGYTSAPTATIAPPGGGGTTATATATIAARVCLGYLNTGATTIHVVPPTGAAYASSNTSITLTCDSLSTVVTLSPTDRRYCVVLLNPCNTGPIPGALVEIVQGGAAVAAATSDAGGTNLCFTVNAGTGYTVRITVSPEFDVFTSAPFTIAGSCTSLNSPLTSPSVAAGYVCGPVLCDRALSRTLILSDSLYGGVTLTYNATGASGAGWYGGVVANVAACPGGPCAAATGVAINYFWSNTGGFGTGSLTVSYSDVLGGCPVTSTGANINGTVAFGSAASTACPPSLLVTWNRPSSSTPGPYCDRAATITITE